MKLNGTWYHNFEKLGINTKNDSIGYQKNQKVKEPEITKMLDIVKGEDKIVNLLELFTSDGYYTFLTNKILNVEKSTCVDYAEKYQPQFNQIKEILGYDVNFIKSDVNAFLGKNKDRYDITLCFGGLYHTDNPFEVIKKINGFSKYTLIQTIVPSDIKGDYFVTPAPNWKHGSRFSVKTLRSEIEKLDCEILYENYNELDKSIPTLNRGSVYFLIKYKK